MGALENPRHEAFAQYSAEGLPAYKAYLLAGYKASVATAWTKSSELLRNRKIVARLRELAEELPERMIVTRESLVADHAIGLAYELGQPAAAISAIAAKQRLMGLDPASKGLNVNVSRRSTA